MHQTFVHRSQLPVTADAAFAWHERPGAFDRLVPPWEQVDVVRAGSGIHDGSQVELKNHLGPFSFRWLVEHRDYTVGRSFRDVQLQGPFARWEHRHTFQPEDPANCVLEDRIEYTPPGGALGKLLGERLIASKLERMFRYRHATTAADLEAHARFADMPTQNVLVSGASGLVGSALIPFLTTGGHRVSRLVRRDASVGDVEWDPATGGIDVCGLEGFDAVVHLAGESIADGRWTKSKKERIRNSRTAGTRLLCESLTKLNRPPRTLICASAIGYYGDRGNELLDENSPRGDGFLADVCRDWEQATEPAVEVGVRVVNLRIGVVLTPKGGALAKMMTPFRLGGGGSIGSGRQYWSWISLDDLIGAIHHALMTESLRGPVNAVSPNPVTNREFTQTLAKVLHRPAILPLPAVAARLVLGEMADGLLLSSARVIPQRLEASNYCFRHAKLEDALRHLLGA